MANYPDAALRIQTELNQILGPPSNLGSFYDYSYAGGSQEEAAEDAVSNAVMQYTRLADSCSCNKVTYGKTYPIGRLLIATSV
jgi:hypothetical protein